MPPLRLPPYEARPGEGLLEKCARIKREIQAAARAGVASNDNEPEAPRAWWREGSME